MKRESLTIGTKTIDKRLSFKAAKRKRQNTKNDQEADCHIPTNLENASCTHVSIEFRHCNAQQRHTIGVASGAVT